MRRLVLPLALVEAHDEAHTDSPLGTELTWAPQLVNEVSPVHSVRAVPRLVGPGML